MQAQALAFYRASLTSTGIVDSENDGEVFCGGVIKFVLTINGCWIRVCLITRVLFVFST